MRLVIAILISLLSTCLTASGQDLNPSVELQNAPNQIEQNAKDLQKELQDADTLEKKLALVGKLYQNVELEQVKEQLSKNLSGSPIENVLKTNPKALDFVARLLKDPTALSKLYEIVTMTNMLIAYLVFYLITYLIKRRIKRRIQQEFVLSRFVSVISYFLIFFVIRLAVFFLMFQEQLIPTINLLRQSFQI